MLPNFFGWQKLHKLILVSSRMRWLLCNVQITASSVRLINSQTSKLCDEWKPPDDRNVSVANCNSSQVVCAVGRDLYYIEIQSGCLKAVGSVLSGIFLL